MEKEIAVTIGIVTWRSKALLKQLLDSVCKNISNISYEIVIVDNFSNDGTLEMIRTSYPDVVLIENSENMGVAPARNKIFRTAKGRYILILDVDTKVLKGSVEKLVEIMDRNPDTAIGGPKLLYGDGRLQLSCRPFPSLLNILIEGTFIKDYFPSSRYVKEYTMEEWDHSSLREVDWVYGAALIIRRSSLSRIGLFDEKFFYLYEDVDLCFRAKKKGMKILYIPEAAIIHFLERENKGIFHKRILNHIKSISRYLLKDYLGLIKEREYAL